MRVVERGGNGFEHREGGLGRHWTGAQPLGKGRSVQAFHDQVRPPGAVSIDAVVGDLHDVGVLQPAECDCLALEALEETGVGGTVA